MNCKEYNFDTTGYPRIMLCWDENNKFNVQECLVLGEHTHDNVKHKYRVLNKHGDIDMFTYVKPITELERTINDVRYGDILLYGSSKFKVLTVIDDIVFLSDSDLQSARSFHSIHDLIDDGYILEEIKTSELVHLTFEDISNGKGKGIPPELIRVKKT